MVHLPFFMVRLTNGGTLWQNNTPLPVEQDALKGAPSCSIDWRAARPSAFRRMSSRRRNCSVGGSTAAKRGALSLLEAREAVLAVLGEELGLVGVLTVVVLFYWMVKRAFEIGRQAIALERTFAGLVAQGVGLWIGVQAFINIGVATGLLPTKGLTLPLMSYGGSSLVSHLFVLGVLRNLARQAEPLSVPRTRWAAPQRCALEPVL